MRPYVVSHLNAKATQLATGGTGPYSASLLISCSVTLAVPSWASCSRTALFVGEAARINAGAVRCAVHEGVARAETRLMRQCVEPPNSHMENGA